MSLVKCKECGADVSTKAKACPGCGAKVPKTKWWLWIPLGLIGAFFAFGATVGNTPEAKEKQAQREAIDLCWSDQKKKSLDPSTQRTIAGACEMLEDRFAKQFGHRP